MPGRHRRGRTVTALPGDVDPVTRQRVGAAKGRAKRQLQAGSLTRRQYDRVVAGANRLLGR